MFRQVVGAWGNEDLIENAFELEEYEAGSTPEVGPFRFSFREVPHFTGDVRDRRELLERLRPLRLRRRLRPTDALVRVRARAPT